MPTPSHPAPAASDPARLVPRAAPGSASEASIPGARMEQRITEVGRELLESFSEVLEALPGQPGGPQALGKALGLDKVFASRLLKSMRRRDPLAVVHHLPGPEPLRRFLRAANKLGVAGPLVDRGGRAVDEFEHLIRQEAGDRSSLSAIISAWLPEAREEFELRRKQAVFKNISQLRGVSAEMNLSTVILHPAADGEHIDVVWVMGLTALRRLRPNVVVKITSNRFTEGAPERDPSVLAGVGGADELPLEEFCHLPPARLEVERRGETVHYVLGPHGFGPRSAVDVLVGEVNLAELPLTVPAGSHRKGYYFATINTPVEVLLFDVIVHEDVYPGREPQLVIHDVTTTGPVDVNDPDRDLDRLDLAESIQSLGRGTARIRVPEMPRYPELVRSVIGRLGWRGESFRAYRCRVEYPIYGTQVSLAFEPPER